MTKQKLLAKLKELKESEANKIIAEKDARIKELEGQINCVEHEKNTEKPQGCCWMADSLQAKIFEDMIAKKDAEIQALKKEIGRLESELSQRYEKGVEEIFREEGRLSAMKMVNERIKKKEQELRECVLNGEAWKMIQAQRLELTDLLAEMRKD